MSVDQHQRKLLLSHKGPLSDVFESGGGREGGCISCVAGEGGKLSPFVTEQDDETKSRSCTILVIYSKMHMHNAQTKILPFVKTSFIAENTNL